MTSAWTLAQMPSQEGKRFFITGANSGVGYAAAVELARRGGVVVLACRDQARAEEARKRLYVDSEGRGAAEVVVLDLASLASVREVAAAEVARNQPLDGLINNAGVMRPPKRLQTKDGFELQFGTNVLGHFALTCALMPALERAKAARVVTLSSISHKRGRIAFEDLQATKSYNAMRGYEQSKLGNLMFAFELERRLRAAKRNIISLAVHPGVAKSNLFKLGSSEGVFRTMEKVMTGAIGLLMNSTLEGAIPTLYAATAAEAEGGGYYGPQGFQEMRGGDVGPAFVADDAKDLAAQKRLWQICEELTGCRLD